MVYRSTSHIGPRSIPRWLIMSSCGWLRGKWTQAVSYPRTRASAAASTPSGNGVGAPCACGAELAKS